MTQEKATKIESILKLLFSNLSTEDILDLADITNDDLFDFIGEKDLIKHVTSVYSTTDILDELDNWSIEGYLNIKEQSITDFDTEELIEELTDRKSLIILPTDNLNDLMKAEWIKENFDKIKEKGNTYVLLEI